MKKDHSDYIDAFYSNVEHWQLDELIQDITYDEDKMKLIAAAFSKKDNAKIGEIISDYLTPLLMEDANEWANTKVADNEIEGWIADEKG